MEEVPSTEESGQDYVDPIARIQGNKKLSEVPNAPKLAFVLSFSLFGL